MHHEYCLLESFQKSKKDGHGSTGLHVLMHENYNP
jgi:hypothetical protein